MSEIVLNRISILNCIRGNLNLNLDANGLEGSDVTDINFLRHAQLILAPSEDEVGIVGPLELAIVPEYEFLLNRVTSSNAVIVMIFQLLEAEAEHLLHLVRRKV